MFPKIVMRRLSRLDSNKYVQSDTEFIIGEDKKDGRAALRVRLCGPSIQFKKVDKHQWKYLANQKCADSVVFQYINGKWALHIFEFKKTIDSDAWKTMQAQFDGAFLNALAMAGFLKIDTASVTVHSCYRRDRLQGDSMEPIELRHALTNSALRDTIDSWRCPDYILHCCKRIPCAHIKTQLDEKGEGALAL